MKSLLFVAGEASGDGHAAALIRALGPDVRTVGAGGPRMVAAGMEPLFDLTEHAVVGFVEVLKNYGKFKRLFDRLVAEAERRRPDAVVLVDFPGFNLRLAAALKRRGFKVIYYISPQVWAWHAGRVKQIQRDVDLVLAIFPFERAWYAKHAPGVRVEFVGHPLLDQPLPVTERCRQTVLLLPGSREQEVRRHWPLLAGVVDGLPATTECVAVAVNEATAALLRHPRVRVEIGTAREWLGRATLAVAASGTVTMEGAVAGCPMLVVYRVNWLTALFAWAVLRVPWLAMPNLIAGREIIPEFVQHRATVARVGAATRELLADPARRAAMQRDLAGVVAALGAPGANERAARLIRAAL